FFTDAIGLATSTGSPLAISCSIFWVCRLLIRTRSPVSPVTRFTFATGAVSHGRTPARYPRGPPAPAGSAPRPLGSPPASAAARAAVRPAVRPEPGPAPGREVLHPAEGQHTSRD